MRPITPQFFGRDVLDFDASSPSLFDRLPDELLALIVRSLDRRALRRVRCVCRGGRLRSLADLAYRRRAAATPQRVHHGEGRARRLRLAPGAACWQRERCGAGVVVSADGRTASRAAAAAGWGSQRVDEFLTAHTTTTTLTCVALGPEAFIGIVGRNFSESDAALGASRHAIVVHATTGEVWMKGRRSPLCLPRPCAVARKGGWRMERRPAIASGATVRLVVEMESRELTVELVEGGEVVGSVTVCEIPAEVAVCVGLGPGAVHEVRVEGERKERADGGTAAMKKDLWDADAVVPPLALEEGWEAQERRRREWVAAVAIATEGECSVRSGWEGSRR